jgi:hypothetical protein
LHEHDEDGEFSGNSIEEEHCYTLRIPERVHESILEDDVLLVMGVNECNVGNMENSNSNLLTI